MARVVSPPQDEYADASDPLPEGLIGNLKEFHVSYTEVRNIGVGGYCDEEIEGHIFPVHCRWSQHQLLNKQQYFWGGRESLGGR